MTTTVTGPFVRLRSTVTARLKFAGFHKEIREFGRTPQEDQKFGKLTGSRAAS